MYKRETDTRKYENRFIFYISLSSVLIADFHVSFNVVVLVDILSIFKFKFLTRLITLVNQLMISLQCAEFKEQIEITFVLLDVFEVFIASLCRFSKYTGYQDWKVGKSKVAFGEPGAVLSTGVREKESYSYDLNSWSSGP